MAEAPRRRRSTRTRRRGQAAVELALVSLVLALLLAGAIDFGRAYFTDVVVTNMAAEGASYAALDPDKDLVAPTCSQYTVLPYANIQDRVRLVAKERGLVIKQADRDNIVTRVTVPGYSPSDSCANRCFGRTIKVEVTYTISDLFLPRLVGISSIPITESATQLILRNAYDSGGTCP